MRTRTPTGNDMRKVLLVEDQMELAEVVRTVLVERGIDARVAPDGESALEMLEAFDADLVLVDLTLPGLSGEDVARALRADGRPGRTLVALTGHEAPGIRERALAAGFDRFEVKPFGLEALEAALDRILGDGAG